MTRLILTSNGLKSQKIKREFISLLDKYIGDVRVLVVHTATQGNGLEFVELIHNELKSFGILQKCIIDAPIAKDISPKDYKDFDVIYSAGGNTFFILERMRKTGFDKLIKDFIGKNGLYVGVSAGSILLGKTIEIAGYGSQGDLNETGLRNLDGFGIINISVYPHYNDDIKSELDDFMKNVDYPVVPLRDGEALIIKDKRPIPLVS